MVNRSLNLLSKSFVLFFALCVELESSEGLVKKAITKTPIVNLYPRLLCASPLSLTKASRIVCVNFYGSLVFDGSTIL